ncbi:hypothetical protein AALP_AA6G247400 [Arabis alpina]|uniref:Pentacotripeptide-repeat region of PRORP domain-containing protein n=1 Tax=Arabis alpina TaxID=50452 RepID=A0A087GRH2_ARAAL|nr:hypothetical protein AALP_AA6G247400 [Arabis alpina]
MRFSPSILVSHLRLAKRAASWRFFAVSSLSPNEHHLKVGNFDLNPRDDPNLALSFLGQLKQHGVSLNVNAYATLVIILSNWGLDRKLDSVLVELIVNEERGFSVMDLIASIGEEAEEDKRSLLLLRVSSSLVKAYVSLRLFDEAIDVLFQSNRLGCVPSIKACNFLMNRMIDFGKTDMVVALFRQLKPLGLYANGYTYAIVVKALCKKGDLEEAAKLLEIAPSVFAYTTFIDGLCVTQKTDQALVLVKELIDTKTLAGNDLETAYGMVVRGFCNEMKMEAAESIILEMEKTGVGPDVHACSVIIDRHCKNMNLPKATGFLNTMVCYNVAFHALSKLGRVEEAIELLQEMMDKGMVPDVINYTTLLDGYCIRGQVVDALDLIDYMRGNGISPDKAEDLFEDMKQRGIKPDVVTYTLLLDNYLKLDPVHHETGSVQGEVRKRRTSELWREFTAAVEKVLTPSWTILNLLSLWL